MFCAGCGLCDETCDERNELCDTCRGRLDEYALACNLDVDPLRHHIESDMFAAAQFIDWLGQHPSRVAAICAVKHGMLRVAPGVTDCPMCGSELVL